MTIIGVEKNNVNARKSYMSSNQFDAPREVLLSEALKASLSGSIREKRGYSKNTGQTPLIERDVSLKKHRCVLVVCGQSFTITSMIIVLHVIKL